MTPEEILKAFDNIRVWQRGDRRAPHKPLLILMALGNLARGEKPRAEFGEIEGKLGRLLEEFGPSGSNATRNYPFWHLATDNLWQLEGPAEILARPPGATPNIGELRTNHVSGGFPPEIQSAFQKNPALAAEVARRVLDAEFHPTAYSIGVNDGPAAGQTVAHLHIHLIPRYAGDDADPRGGVRRIFPKKAKYW